MNASKSEREKRLAEALRANLRKRKGLGEVPPVLESDVSLDRKQPR